MDTSETYIKMRIAAMPDLGRGEPLESTFRSENYYVLENDEYSVFLSMSGNWYTFHLTIERSDQGRTCQLERQDQLQEMLGLSLLNLLVGFNHFLELDKTPSYAALFTSMEQLWLAFVMKELHQKTWDGDKWKSSKPDMV